MPTAVCSSLSLCVFITVCHCCSAWLPPADTPSILQAQDVREDFYLRLFFNIIKCDKSFLKTPVSDTATCFHECVTHKAVTRTLQVDMGRCHMSGVVHLQSFPVCLLWHDLYIVLSTPTPELVSKSRFNLHASCLQEEEVEEFRVSLSWYRVRPVSVWTSRNSIHPAPPPPP